MTPSDTDTQISSAPPIIVSRSDHSISRKNIDDETLKVLYRLHRQGFKAYLVGGGVRDLLLGRSPKDFDVGTDATPSQVKKIFRNCFLVGRRFRLAHVRFGRDKVVEVATFRRKPREEDLPEDPAERFLVAENVFGTPQEDAFRRDFTINALFYDVSNFSIIDYAGGLKDLREGRIRVIGDPMIRFVEDPVRMLRALEFKARLNFSLGEHVREAIYERAPMIAEAAPARIREEISELFRHKVGGKVLREASATGLLPYLLAGFEGDNETFDLLDQLDRRAESRQPVQEPLILATLYLSRFRRACPADGSQGITDAVRLAGLVLAPHCGYFHIAHGVRHQARELLVGFFRFSRGRGHRGERRFLNHPATQAAWELFRLWQKTTGEDPELLTRWSEAFKNLQSPKSDLQPPPVKRHSRRRRPPRRRPPSPTKENS